MGSGISESLSERAAWSGVSAAAKASAAEAAVSEEAASEAAASERRLQRLCEAPALIVPLKQTLERLTLAPRIGIAAQPAANA